MKKAFVVIAVLFFLKTREESNVYAQVGNEWIVYTQPYVKIKVAQDKIYRLTYQNLSDAGFPVAGDPRKFQLFYRGAQQAILVQGEGDGVFDNTDYIEFYGQKNNGYLDQYLYVTLTDQPNPYYNIYSDSTALFLTIGASNGKRMSLFSQPNMGLPAEPYHLEEKLLVLSNEYSEGQRYPYGSLEGRASLSSFDKAEGWTGVTVSKGAQLTYTITGVDNIVSTGPKPSIDAMVVGRNNRPHKVNIAVGPATLRSIRDVDFDYFDKFLVSELLEFADITGTGEFKIRLTVNGDPFDPGPDAASVSYIKFLFPQLTDMSGASSKIFQLEARPGGKSYIEIMNAPVVSAIYDITDINNVSVVGFTQVGAQVTCVVSNTISRRRLLVTSDPPLLPKIEQVNFRKIDPAKHNYLIITHKTLTGPAGSFSNASRAYADYRASVGGGKYDTLLIDIDQVYNQFAYGELAPIALRRFASFMLKTGKPEYLFIIGKARRVMDNYNRTNAGGVADLIPLGGWPGSDIVYTSGLGTAVYEPAIATGRLLARTPQDIINYLNKVKEYESAPQNDLAKKEILQLSGGFLQGEIELFKLYIQGFKAIAEGKYLGAHVTNLSKSINAGVQLINVSEYVNKGLVLLTFLGHAAPRVTDIEIGFASDPFNNYVNKGKYFMMLVNGCNTANVFNPTVSLSEDWTLIPDKGAILFLANSSEAGYANILRNYSDVFYKVAFADSVYLNQSVGKIQQEVIRRFTTDYGDHEINIGSTQQMFLQGDPAIRLFPSTKPDYQIANDQLFIKSYGNLPLNALSDSFSIACIVKNFGRVKSNVLPIRVRRTLSTGKVLQYDTVVNSTYYKDTIYVRIKSKDATTFGLNKFEVALDPYNLIDEVDETNNTAFLDFFMPLNKVAPLYPIEFSIVNTLSVDLIAQPTNVLADDKEYLFEIDTSYLFNSAWKQKKIFLKDGGLPNWKVNLISNSPANDTTAYYWRVKFNDGIDTKESWAYSTFTYIKNGPEGWTQSIFPQMLNDATVNLIKNETMRKFEFYKERTKVKVKTVGGYVADSNKYTELYLDDIAFVYNARCFNNTMLGIAFDRLTAKPYSAFTAEKGYSLSGYYCGRQPIVVNMMVNPTVVSKYIDEVKDGDYLVLSSTGSVAFETWPNDLKQKLKDVVGVDLVEFNKLKNGYGCIIIGQKNSGKPATLIIPNLASPIPAKEQILTLDYNVLSEPNKGYVYSPKIGPALSWQTFYRHILPAPLASKVAFDIIGVGLNDQETVLFSNITTNAFGLSSIDAKQYPYLKLKATVNDITPPQLRSWRVHFGGVPEGVVLLDPKQDKPLNDFKINIQEGELSKVYFQFVNISKSDFKEPLQVEFSLTNQTTLQKAKLTKGLTPLVKGDTLKFSYDFNSLNKIGPNDFQVYVNPKVQPEQYYYNNILNLSSFFVVAKDITHPVLDVIFDGNHIMDGDIVSPHVLAGISLKDENNYLLRKDTAGIDIFIKKPCEGCQFERLSFTDPALRWIPAGTDNRFKIDYQFQNLPNGIYTFRVQASDVTGNRSGLQPYQINFEVINESQITHFYPYPNPFSTKMRFVFTLTGSEIPDEIKIQIMTVTGKIVREVTQDELGPIKIGNNLSSFEWDGKDEYGDQLANGVYLYKVFVKKNGEYLETRTTAADKAFHKGFGKIYLLR